MQKPHQMATIANTRKAQKKFKILPKMGMVMGLRRTRKRRRIKVMKSIQLLEEFVRGIGVNGCPKLDSQGKNQEYG